MHVRSRLKVLPFNMMGLVVNALGVVAFALVVMGANDCTTITTLHSEAQTNCAVSDIREMFASSELGEGAVELCTPACTASIRSLYLAGATCNNMDTLIGYTNAQAEITTVYETQLQCHPSRAECMIAYRNLERWLNSKAGQGCTDNVATVASGGNRDDAQARIKLICESECGPSYDYYMTQLETAGCNTWWAYKEMKTRFTTTCSKVDTTFCLPVFNPTLMEAKIDIAKDATKTLAERDAALTDICSPCFHEYLRAATANNIDPQSLVDLRKLCVKDEDRFCYPRYIDGVAATSGDADKGVNAQARQLCQIGVMGRCANKMFAIENAEPSTDGSVITVNDIHMKHMCTRTVEGQLCADLTMEITDGFGSDGTYRGAKYLGPLYCDQVRSSDFCTWGCQRRFETVRDSFGCCYETTKEYFQELVGRNLNQEDVTAAFAQTEIVATECTRPVAASCASLSNDTTVEITFPIPYEFVKENGTTVTDAMKSDILVTLGLPVASVTFDEFREANDGINTVVELTISGFHGADVTRITDGLTSDTTNGALMQLSALRVYNGRCIEESLGCSSAAALLASTTLFAISLFVSTFVF